MALVLRSLRAGCAVSAFLLAALGPGALVAAGDDGPSRATRSDRPTRTVLRPVEVPELAPQRAPVASAKEVVVLVSGINSYPQDPTFDALVAKLFDDPRYEIRRFGADPDHPYDALGALDTNARNLTDEVRALGATHPAVHIVAHSMGGAVVDRAFAGGLSARDGVATYIALASPHNGSPALAAADALLSVAGGSATEVRAAFSAKLDPGSDAAKGLARVRPVPPAAGVTRLDLRMSTDWTVTARDAKDPGVLSRTIGPSDLRGVIDGHGAVTRDPKALALIMSTIDQRTLPPDDRNDLQKWSDGLLSSAAAYLALQIALLAILLAICICGALTVMPWLRPLTGPLAAMQLRRVRLK